MQFLLGLFRENPWLKVTLITAALLFLLWAALSADAAVKRRKARMRRASREMRERRERAAVEIYPQNPQPRRSESGKQVRDFPASSHDVPLDLNAETDEASLRLIVTERPVRQAEGIPEPSRASTSFDSAFDGVKWEKNAPEKTVKLTESNSADAKKPYVMPKTPEEDVLFIEPEKPKPRAVSISEPTQLLSQSEILAALNELKKAAPERTVMLAKSADKSAERNTEQAPPQAYGASGVRPRKYSVGSAMHIGTRKYQQDSIFVSNPDDPATDGMLLGVICDGMGGMANGEQASGLAVETISRDFYELGPNAEIPAFLESEAHKIDGMINETLSGGRGDGSAGTTMAAVVLKDNLLYWASVGDSRIYILRGREIVQVTRDHNFQLLLTQRMNKGEISEEAVEAHADKAALISYLGMGGLEMLDCNPQALPLQEGDMILLCSDGLTGSLSNAQIRKFIEDGGDNMVICARILTHKAFEYRKTANQDNTSVIMIRYNGQ